MFTLNTYYLLIIYKQYPYFKQTYLYGTLTDHTQIGLRLVTSFKQRNIGSLDTKITLFLLEKNCILSVYNQLSLSKCLYINRFFNCVNVFDFYHCGNVSKCSGQILLGQFFNILSLRKIA